MLLGFASLGWCLAKQWVGWGFERLLRTMVTGDVSYRKDMRGMRGTEDMRKENEEKWDIPV